jgi:hypothetical protein
VCYRGKHQIEYFNIKSLCRALIIILDHSTEQRKSHLEQQLVCLVRTSWVAGVGQPVSFQGLEIQQPISDEVVVLLLEAVRFVMKLDEHED